MKYVNVIKAKSEVKGAINEINVRAKVLHGMRQPVRWCLTLCQRACKDWTLSQGWMLACHNDSCTGQEISSCAKMRGKAVDMQGST